MYQNILKAGALCYRCVRLLCLGLILLSLCSTASAQNMAQRFSAEGLDKMVFDTKVMPHWLRSGMRFWYSYKTTKGTFYYLVDLDKKTKRELFDPHQMAAKLTLLTKNPYDFQHLPAINPRFKGDETFFQFDIGGSGLAGKTLFHLQYDLKTGKLEEYKEKPQVKRGFTPGWLNISPDSAYAVYVKGHNLFYMEKTEYLKFIFNEKGNPAKENQLTRDGVEGYGYEKGASMKGPGEASAEPAFELRQPADILWSPDSKRFAIIRKDDRKVKLLWTINSLATPRPTLQSYKYQMPAEVDPTESELLVFNILGKKVDTIKVSKFQNQSLKLPERKLKEGEGNEGFNPDVWMSDAPGLLYFSRQSRDLQQYEFCRVNLLDGKVSVLISEKMNSYVESSTPLLINGGKELIFLSERDGWSHFYLYDSNGKLERQLTSGSWHCSYDGFSVDEKRQLLYFCANGREALEDPYYRHFYRVRLDGKGLSILNKGNFDHSSELSPGKQFFIDNYSRVNTIPESVVRDNEGRLVLSLEKADLSALFAAGYKFPEPFKLKANDGQTDIYGVMYKPFDFDSTRRYPIVEYVYPGPQTESVNKSFSLNMDRTDRLAQMGLIVVTLGNRGGSPERSKWYHNYGYGNMRDYGLADKKYAVEQLADRYKFIDIDQVGIYGHSGGGFMAAAAICQYPDFYKVAISASGNHDNNIYNNLFTEKYNGLKATKARDGSSGFQFDVATNAQLAANLKGHLLLVTGDMDNNVHPANTIRLAAALINANKRFDFFMLPGQSHIYRNTEYCFWLFADYFAKYLLGQSPTGVSMPIGNSQLLTPFKNENK